MTDPAGVGRNALEMRLDELEQGVKGGLRFANLLSSVNQEDLRKVDTLLNALVEILISKGLLHFQEIDDRKNLLEQSFAEHRKNEPHVELVAGSDKYQISGSGVDCRARKSVCRANCCSFWFPLSVQDLDEGVVKWDYFRPYGIARGTDGYCVHLDQKTLECTIYDQRPAVCRSYHCRDDKRVWENFDTCTPSQSMAAIKACTAGETLPDQHHK